jgi:hypothetical protein
MFLYPGLIIRVRFETVWLQAFPVQLSMLSPSCRCPLGWGGFYPLLFMSSSKRITVVLRDLLTSGLRMMKKKTM